MIFELKRIVHIFPFIVYFFGTYSFKIQFLGKTFHSQNYVIFICSKNIHEIYMIMLEAHYQLTRGPHKSYSIITSLYWSN